MNKILLILSFTLLLNASQFEDTVKLTNEYTIQKLESVFADYKLLTGETPDVTKVRKDISLLKAIKMFETFNQKTKIRKFSESSGKFSDMSISLPNYRKALEDLSKSKDPLASWLGINIITTYLTSFDKTGKRSSSDLKYIVNKYFPIFINKLKNENHCYIDYTATVYYKQYNKNLDKYEFYLNRGVNSCKEEHVPKWLKKYMLMEKVQRDAYLKFIKKTKENRIK